MRLGKRLDKVQKALAGRPRADQFQIIELMPLGREAAEGRPPGLYRDGAEGSCVGMLVYDPAGGEPEIPEGRLAPWGLVILHGAEEIEPPADLPRE